eukprot:scaffold120105_cov118-Phaeocystis_antarctica.AAC.6
MSALHAAQPWYGAKVAVPQSRRWSAAARQRDRGRRQQGGGIGAAVVAVHRRVAHVRDYRRVPLRNHLALARRAGGELVKDHVALGDGGWPACSTSVA